MRRKERELTKEDAFEILDSCDYVTLSLAGEGGAPYGVSIDIVRSENSVYFHCAKEGRKIEMLKANPKVCISGVGNYSESIGYTRYYRSAVVFGVAHIVNGVEEKKEALRLLCSVKEPNSMERFEKAVSSNSFQNVDVWRVDIEEITGKGNSPSSA